MSIRKKIDVDVVAANLVLCGPTSGSSVAPTYRSLVIGDLPTITYAKLQSVSATDKLLGRASSGAGVVEEITCTAFGRSLLDDANAAAALVTLGAQPLATNLTSFGALTNAAGYLYNNGSGTLSYATPTASVSSADDLTTATAVYPLWMSAAGANPVKISTTKISFVPSTGNLTLAGTVSATSFDAATLNLGTSTATSINLGTASTTQTVNIGTGSGTTTINLGSSGDTVNIAGTLAYVNTTNLQVTDKLVTLNKGGATGSGSVSGLEVEENGAITSYLRTTGDRAGWEIKAPGATGVLTLSPGSSNAFVVLSTDSRLTDSRPASDVYSWAKASSKPSYTYAEVGAVPANTIKDLGIVCINPVNASSATCTTAQFVAWLVAAGMHTARHCVAKCTWDYAGNNDISDAPWGNIELAGSVIETWSDGTYYTIRIIRPNTGAMPAEEFIYNDQGASYNPGWRRVWTSFNFDPASKADAATAITTANIGSQSVSYANSAGNTNSLGGNSYANFVQGDGPCRVSTATANFNDALPSGFYNYSGPTSNGLDAASWHHLIIARHSNRNNNYQMQLAQRFGQDELYFRNVSGSIGSESTTPWRSVVHSGNIGSQSVNYATSAGSAPASDVYAWAKAATKPTYTASEVDALSNAYLSGVRTDTADVSSIGGGVSAYYLDAGATNHPTGQDHALFTLAYNSAWAVQLAGDWRTNNWYARNENNGTWGSWTQFITSANISSQSVNYATTAGTANGLGGAAAYTGEDTLTFAQRNAKGVSFGRTQGASDAPGGSGDYYNYLLLPEGIGAFSQAILAMGNANGRIFYGYGSWNAAPTWRELVHSGNIGSQSVNYATSAGTAGNSGKLAGAEYSHYLIRDDFPNNRLHPSDGTTADNPFHGSTFSYSAGTPWSGPIVSFGGLGGNNYALQINSTYNDTNGRIAWRCRNGDNGDWNPWRELWHSGNFDASAVITTANIGSQSVAYASESGFLRAEGNYLRKSADSAGAYGAGITVSFVQGSDGWDSFGSLATIRGYSGGGGGTLQLYTPYSATYGGKALKYRTFSYDSSAWTEFKTIIDSENIGSQSVNYANSAGAVTNATFSTTFKVQGRVSTDCNTIVDPGFFGVDQTASNRPADWGSVVVSRSADCVGQLYMGINHDHYVRGGNPSQSGGGGTWQSWERLITSYNIGSQSVNYATSAGSANLAPYAYNSTVLDLSGLDQSTWYPVTIPLPTDRRVRCRVMVALNMGSVPSWATHASGFTAICDWTSNGYGWGSALIMRTIHNYVYSYANVSPVGGINQLGNGSIEYIYLRGGGKYKFESDYPVTPTLQTSSYTVNSETVAPTTTLFNDVFSSATCDVGFASVRATGQFIGSGAGLTGTAASLIVGKAQNAYIPNTNIAIGNSTGDGVTYVSGFYYSGSFGLIVPAQVVSSSNFKSTLTGSASFLGNWTGDNYWGMGSNGAHSIRLGMVDANGAFQTDPGDISLNIDASIITGSAITAPTFKTSQIAMGNGNELNSIINDWLYLGYRTTAGVRFGNNKAAVDCSTGAIYTTSTIQSAGIMYAPDFSASSDKRLKTDIKPILGALDKVKAIKGITFKWNELSSVADKETEQVGVLAQDVLEVLPQAVNQSGEYLSVSYGKLVPLLIEAIKELQEQVNELRSR